MPLQKIGTFKVAGQDVELWSDIKTLQRQVRRFGGSIKSAQARAMNRAATKGKTYARKLLYSEYNVKSRSIGKHLSVWPRAKAMRLNAGIQGRSSRLSIYKHTRNKPKQTPLGVRFNAGGGMSVKPHTFIATLKSGHTGVFVRHPSKRKRVKRTDAQGRVYRSQLPIRELTYPSVAHMLTEKDNANKVWVFVTRDYQDQLVKQLDYELLKARGIT